MARLRPVPPGSTETSQFVEKYEPLRRHGYIADFSRDIRMFPPIYHVVITKAGSAEILLWVQCESLEEARSEATKRLSDLSNPKRETAEAGT